MIAEINRRSVPDNLVRRYILPERIVWQSQGAAGPKHSHRLLQDTSLQPSTQDTQCCLLDYRDQPPGILLDFGCELNGGIRMVVNETSDDRPVRVRIRFGESVSEAMGCPDNDHAMHDWVVPIPRLSASEFGNTGFRFVRIDLVDPGTRVEIRQICAVFVFREVEYKGEFECSDPRLNQIWRTGRYTVHLNMQEYLWDGIKRDRLVWLGDIHPEVMTINYAFGNHEIVPRSLDFVRDRAPLPNWMNAIPSYSLWWILVQKDWYLYQGDREYLEGQRSYLLGLLEQLSGYINHENRETLPDMRFLDWPTSEDKHALNGGLQALMILAFKAAAWLCRHLAEFPMELKCKETVRRLLTCPPANTNRKQAIAMMVLAGMMEAQKANRLFLGKDPCGGLSPFLGYYVLQARAMARDYQGAMEVIRNYWGAMLDLGATSFWEDFDIVWKDSSGRIDELVPEGKRDFHAEYGNYCYKGIRHSLCHGWSGGPTAWLGEHVLGFRPVEPGARKLLIRPELGSLEWARGAFPTPYGVVTVSHSRDRHGHIQTHVEKPEEVELVENPAPVNI